MERVAPPRPLAGEDELAAFACGRPALNLWLQRHAWRNQKADASRTSVLCCADTGDLIAYVSLASAEIVREHLPKPMQRNKPDPVPTVLLGQLAVDLRYQGQGHARSLLLFALRTAVRLSAEIGCFGVITHPIDEDARRFYLRWGFESLPGHPHDAMILRMADIRASGIE